MAMNKFNFKKSALGLAVVVGSLAMANAQWSVHEVNSNAMKGTLEDVLSALKTQVSNQNAAQAASGIASRQQSIQLEETDRRNRANAALADTIKRDRDAMPTLKRCYDLSRGRGSAAGGAANMRKGGGGKGPDGADAKRSEIKNEATREYEAVKALKTKSVCVGTEMEVKSGFCSEVNKFPGAVISPRTLMGNFEGDATRTYKNYTLNDEAFKAAVIYIETATINNSPPELDKNTIADNKYYLTSYHKTVNGLQTAYDAMYVVSLPFAEMKNTTGELDDVWATMAPVYSQLQMTPPEKPSLAELFFSEIAQDYYMLKDVKPDNVNTEIDVLKEMNRKMSLNNMLTHRQVQLAEYQTILLSHLVAQSYLPEANRLTNEARMMTEAAKGKK